jgi:hypothetical protein
MMPPAFFFGDINPPPESDMNPLSSPPESLDMNPPPPPPPPPLLPMNPLFGMSGIFKILPAKSSPSRRRSLSAFAACCLADGQAVKSSPRRRRELCVTVAPLRFFDFSTQAQCAFHSFTDAFKAGTLQPSTQPTTKATTRALAA